MIFQSTPPVKAATRLKKTSSGGLSISIHAAREGGDCFKNFLSPMVKLSIHAAREGGDLL